MATTTGTGRTLLALALLAAGALWLLVATGFVPTALLDVLASWWPLFLVGGGLDLLLPRYRPLRIPYTAIASLVVVVLALLGVTLRGPNSVAYRIDLGTAARTASVTLRLGSAPTTVHAATGRNVFEASFTGDPSGDITLDGSRVDSLGAAHRTDDPSAAADGTQLAPGASSSRPVIEVRPRRGTTATFLARSDWSVGLPTALPVALDVAAGSAATTLDLTTTALTALSLDAGSGSLHADLPGLGATYTATVTGGSGSVELWIAPGASLDLDGRFRSGSADIRVGEGSDMRLSLRTGSGALTLDLPDTAPIHLDVRDDGSGRLTLPAYLTRRSGSGDTGVWVSDTLDRGGRVIDVRIEQVGSGSITIR